MRIRIALTLATLAALLLLPTAAAAGNQGFKVDAAKALMSYGRSPERAALGNGTCTVTGSVLALDGTPQANAAVQWAYRDQSGGLVTGKWAQTDAAGHFSFSDVTVTNKGRLSAWLGDNKTMFRSDGLAFAPGANDYVLRSGALTVQATRSTNPDWNDWTTIDTELYGSGGEALSEISGSSGQAYAMAPSVDYGVVYFWNNEAVEWQASSAIPIVTGALSSSTVAVDEADALQVWVGTPYWASGKPGATVGYHLTNWPAGYKATFAGYSADPDRDISVQYPGDWTSTGSGATVALAVPANATPGYDFGIGATRSDSLWPVTHLSIYDSYQVCTLKASKTAVRKGGWITVSGVIPTQGHSGSDAGISKTVKLYTHQGVADVPRIWDPKSEGWQKICSMKADGFGRYKSKSFRPNRTLTLVVRYPGDDWYRDAYTSTQKITVK